MGASCLAIAFALTGCGEDEKDTGVLSIAECNPLGGNGCITPWPSNLYSVADSTTATGVRVDIPLGALPTNQDGITIDPARLNTFDGFSPAAPMIFSYEGGMDGSNLVPNSRYADSITDSSPTVLIDMSTGERVVHFAELDIREKERFGSQALYIRPSVRLKPGTRYAAAIRKSLKARDGSEIPLSDGFAAILSGKTTKHERLEARRAQYDEVLAAVEAAGVPRDDVIVAWDFSTGSDELLRSDLTVARDRSLEIAGVDGANLSYEIAEDRTENGFRRVDGTFKVPLLLNNGGDFVPDTAVLRDSDGLPAPEGTHDVPFTTVIPECAISGTEKVSIMVYGHGLFGDEGQAATGALRPLSEQMCMIIIGTIMRGMSDKDIPNVLLTLNDFSRADRIFDTLLQGIINHIALVQAVRGPMAETLFLNDQGASIADIDNIYYYGLSQGHIFGATVAAYDPHIERAVLGVGGANYSMMLERSLDWPTYRTVVIGAYDDPLNVAILVNLMQMRWDTTEPTNVISGLPGAPIPGTPDKQFLLHMAVGDDEVPNISTEYQARTMGIPVLAPEYYEPYGVPAMAGPLSSALVIFNNGDGPIPEGNEPPPDNRAHSLTRESQAGRDQIQTFFETGEIIHTCGDNTPCDCTMGACDLDD
jgi:hypothetical protein